MEFYSQSGEEAPLIELFADISHRGVCVEVGAYDGVTYSNTLYFEKLGWTVVLVEPVPALFEKIVQARRARAFNLAAGASRGTVTLCVAQGMEDYLSAIVPSARYKRQIAAGQVAVREITVRVDTLDHMLEEAGIGKVDFVSIDVEGYELDVLRGFTLSRHCPRVVLIEDPSDLYAAADRKVFNFMKRFGYARFHRCGCNDYYAPLTDPVFHGASFRSFRSDPTVHAGRCLALRPARWCAGKILPPAIVRRLGAVRRRFHLC